MTPKPKNIAERFLKKSKKKMKQILLGVFILVILIVGGIFWWNKNTQAPNTNQELESFVIPKGSSAMVIANKLKDAGLIKDTLAFKFYVQFTGKQKSIQAGEYRLSAGYSLPKLVSILVKGPDEVWVTIPEGLRKEEIAQKFIDGLGKTSQEADTFKSDFLNLTKNEEGYLFPDTYLFAPAASAQSVVSRMTSVFEQQVDSEIREKIASSGYTLDQTIILASLLERETKGNEEKPIVAGIIIKRLEAGWPLQIDASVQYAVANQKLSTQNPSEIRYWESLTKADLALNSAYNLYKNQGLPPTPVCNPGIVSIKSAAAPEPSEYWFYIHDSSGKIHYARTIEEHNSNVAKYLK